ncbi:hypothetical protein DL546_000560 [Coniochaeta pulveracea]|uniref:DNA polymerase epsilon subunit D n=1 Tax=Coniochaeta pulveracea TaxID=177199 RepID=A0A420XVZ1_9PEZI|nr:hypothetical protein DL546_000560 [Coniochaeta pulveracea]
MPSRKSDARRSIADDSEMPSVQHDTPAPPSEALAAAHLTSETPSAAPTTAPPESTTTTGGGDHNPKGKSRADPDTITIEDLTLPKSIIPRLAKGVLPPNTQIQANAILALSKSATVFINHLANAANEITLMSGKKTIMPPDVFRALDDVEYGFMRERLEAEFATANGGADDSMMSTGTGMGDETSLMANTTVGTETGEARAVKKVKVDSSSGEGRMEVDGEERGGEGEVSDAETVPDEEVEEDESGDEEQEEEEEEGSDEEGDDRGREGEDDELEERPNRGLEDEALDDDDSE